MKTPKPLAWLKSLLSADAPAAPGAAPLDGKLFGHAFKPGFTLTIDEAGHGKPAKYERVGFRLMPLGTVTISSGAIAACDPFIELTDTQAFTVRVPNGDHPVRLALVDGGASDGRIAFARVDFSTAEIVHWALALTPEQDLSTLKPHHIFGYGVDAGTGCFFDPAVAATLVANTVDFDTLYDEWQQAGEANGRAVAEKPSFFLNVKTAAGTIAMFASGWGDGYYASYFGYDADGRAAALLTDFAIIDPERMKD